MSSPTADLTAIWVNPRGVTTFGMLIGGEIVHTALSRSSGTSFTPTCFSFGWVAFAFSALRSVFSSEGRLLPPPDITGLKVFNLTAGTVRTNRNWAVSRLMSTLESRIARETPMLRDGMRITVFRPTASPAPASKPHHRGRLLPRPRKTTTINLVTILLQIGLAIASRPWRQGASWITLIATTAGILLGSAFASLPQWGAEKLPERRRSPACFAMTRGGGFKDIVVVYGAGDRDGHMEPKNGAEPGQGWFDLEKLAAAESPSAQWRQWPRPKKKPPSAATVAMGGDGSEGGSGGIVPSFWTRGYTNLGIPVQLWITRGAAFLHAMLWLAVLVTICGLETDHWYLLGIGALGLVANLVIGLLQEGELFLGGEDVARELELADSITTAKTRTRMEVLMEFEKTYGCGGPLLGEFMAGNRPMTKDEQVFWSEDTNRSEKEAVIARRMTERSGMMSFSFRKDEKKRDRVREREVDSVRGVGAWASVLRDVGVGSGGQTGIETVDEGSEGGAPSLEKVLSVESEPYFNELDSGTL